MEYFKIGLILLLGARLVEHVRRRIRRRGAWDVIVPQREFALATPGECVFAIWHQGRLGDNWVSGYEHAFAEDCDREKVE